MYILYMYVRRWYWDMVMLVLLISTVTTLPVSIAFYSEVDAGWLTVNIVTDTLFILDIIVNFRTGLIKDSSQQVSNHVIHYAHCPVIFILRITVNETTGDVISFKMATYLS